MRSSFRFKHWLSYHIISCHIISYHIISYHIISYISLYIRDCGRMNSDFGGGGGGGKSFYLCPIRKLLVKIHAFSVSGRDFELYKCTVSNGMWLSPGVIALSLLKTIDWNYLKYCRYGKKRNVQKNALTSVTKFHMPFKYISFAC